MNLLSSPFSRPLNQVTPPISFQYNEAELHDISLEENVEQESEAENEEFYIPDSLDDINGLKAYLEMGGDPNIVDECGNGLLHSANPERLDILLKYTPNLDLQNSFGYSALHTYDDLNMISKLLIHGAKVNIKTNRGQTPLHFNVDERIVKLLLDYGADPNVQDEQGKTPLMTAKSPAAVEMLIEHGANMDLRDSYGETAVCYSSYENLNVLLSNGASLTGCNRQGQNILHCTRDTRKMKTLLAVLTIDEVSGLINAVDANGMTPIFYARNSDMIKLLLDNGANVGVQDEDGNTPLHRRHMMPLDTSSAILLLRAGCDPYIKNKYGKRAIDYCRDERVRDILQNSM